MRTAIVAAAICLSVAGLAAADQAGASIRRPTEIPAQSLGDALKALAKVRELQVLYFSDTVRGLRTRGASGELTMDEALTQILAGTGLTYRYIDKQTVTILPTQPLSSSEDRKSDGHVPAPPAALAPTPAEARKSWWRLAQNDDRSAQARGGSDDAAARSAAAEDKVQEVIVTATKRAESIQDVPISMAVVTAEDIDKRGLVGAEDYLRGIPGVNQVGSSGGIAGQAIIIRGIETTTGSQNFYSGATVGTYFGETPTTASAGQLSSNVDIKLVDIERVEVLRGPQGTAFGSASMGGTVRTIPVAPKLGSFEGKVAANYSVTSGPGGDNYMFQGVGNVPIVSDKLAIRATAYVFSDSGYYRNRAGSDPVFQAAAANYGAQAYAVDEDHVGSSYVAGGRVAALFQPTDALRFTFTYLNQKTESNGLALQNIGSFEQVNYRLASEHVSRGEQGPRWDTRIEISNLVAEYDLGWADLLGTYSYINGETEAGYAYSIFYPLSLGVYPQSSALFFPHHEHNGELRLVTKFDGPWNFLAGVYTEKSDDVYNIPEYVWFGDPAANFYNPPTRNLGHYYARRDVKQRAAFGEASWRFLPKFTLTGGARTSRYDRADTQDTAGPVVGNSNLRGEVEDSSNIFRANLSYKPVDDALLYVGWSQGFRLGRSQPIQPGLCDTDANGIIDGTSITVASASEIGSDDVDSYELGAKFSAFDRRLAVDAAVFRMDWNNIPVNVRVGSSCAYAANAGAAKSDGVELQASFRATDTTRVDLGGSYIHARLVDDVPAQGFRAGDKLPSPEVNANLGLQQDLQIAGHPAFVRADAIYIGPFYGNVNHTPNTRSGDYVKLDLTARIMLKNVKLDLFARNLTDEDAFTSRSHYTFVGDQYGYVLRPRTIGMQLNYDF